MILDTFIKQIQQNPENETEVLWFQKQFIRSDNNPIEKYKKELFLDFKISAPSSAKEERDLILVLIILLCKYELEEGFLPGSYRLNIEEVGYLDEIKDIKDFTISLLTKLIYIYYGANEKNEIEKLEDAFQNDIIHWNWDRYTKQEQVIALVGDSLKAVAEKAKTTERFLPVILQDYYDRIDKKRLKNLETFLRKSEEILSSTENQKYHTKFFSKILEELNNGGENLYSIQDLIPYYSGIKFN
jgi:hypothetical protein